MFTNETREKKIYHLSLTIVLILSAGGCAQNPLQTPPVTTTQLSNTSPAFTYPENSSDATGWGTNNPLFKTSVCLSSAPALMPSETVPTIQQSPINFTSAGIKLTNTTSAVTLHASGAYDGLDNNVVFATTLIFAGNSYTTLGFHLHSPVEHTLPTLTVAQGGYAGQPAPQLELHMKAVDKSGKVVVFVVQYQVNTGQSIPWSNTLDTLSNLIASPGIQGASAVSLNNTLQLFTSQPFYSYIGSLTTPPCTTGVQFFVLKLPRQIQATQMTIVLNNLQKVAKMPPNNNRAPRQLTDPAPVTLYNPPAS